MGKKSGSGYGMNKPDHIFGMKILKFFYVGPGWKKVGSGINSPDPQDWLKC
jgi:hypothetical protein